MTASTELTIHQGAAEVVTREYLTERRELIRSQLAKDASDAEMSMFLEVCAARGLNPLTGQIHAVMRWDNREKRQKMSIQTGIDGFRLVAQRTGEYRGQIGPQWCGPDGEWRDVWLEDTPPAAARVGVLRAGWREPLYGVARWKSYVQTAKDGSVTRMWAQMPDVMLAKVAEALALRKAFPEDLSGLYTGDEMAQADSPPAPAVAPGPSDEEALAAERARALLEAGPREVVVEAMREAGIGSAQLHDDDVFHLARAAVVAAVEAAEAPVEDTREEAA